MILAEHRKCNAGDNLLEVSIYSVTFRREAM
jgi:hypothetical protein